MISVLLPTYARPEFLRESIECFLRQTYTDSELVVMNDWRGHTVSFDHPRVRVFNNTSGKRRSLGATRNWLCSQAAGDIVTDWDDDDIYLPDHLESALSMMSLYPKCKISKQRWQWKWNVDRPLCRIAPAAYLHTLLMDKSLRNAMGGYADKTTFSDSEFLERMIKSEELVCPGQRYHKPTFIQRFHATRERVSSKKNIFQSDAAVHACIDREAEALGITGNISIEPRWNEDYQAMADASYEAVLRTGWGRE